LFTPKVYKKGQFIFHEGEYLTKNFFVCRGLVKLVCNDSDAREHIVSFAMEDWWETDFEASYTQKKQPLGNGIAENREQPGGCRCFSQGYGSLCHFHNTGTFGHGHCRCKATRTKLPQMQEPSAIDLEQGCKMPR